MGSRGTESFQNYDSYLTPIRPAELIKPAVPFVNYVNNFVNTKTGQNSSNIESGWQKQIVHYMAHCTLLYIMYKRFITIIILQHYK